MKCLIVLTCFLLDFSLSSDELSDIPTTGLSCNCLRLVNCVKKQTYGPNGTLSFLALNSRPARYAKWNAIRRGICKNKDKKRQECSYMRCENVTLREMVMPFRTLTTDLCGQVGHRFLTDFYMNKKSCLGNLSAIQKTTNAIKTCIGNLDKSDLCRFYDGSRTCRLHHAGKICGDLYQYFQHVIWRRQAIRSASDCFVGYKNSWRLPYPGNITIRTSLTVLAP